MSTTLSSLHNIQVVWKRVVNVYFLCSFQIFSSCYKKKITKIHVLTNRGVWIWEIVFKSLFLLLYCI